MKSWYNIVDGYSPSSPRMSYSSSSRQVFATYTDEYRKSERYVNGYVSYASDSYTRSQSVSGSNFTVTISYSQEGVSVANLSEASSSFYYTSQGGTTSGPTTSLVTVTFTASGSASTLKQYGATNCTVYSTTENNGAATVTDRTFLTPAYEVITATAEEVGTVARIGTTEKADLITTQATTYNYFGTLTTSTAFSTYAATTSEYIFDMPNRTVETTTYNPELAYLEPVYEADSGEVLYSVTAIQTGINDITKGLTTFTKTTITGIGGGILANAGTPYGTASLPQVTITINASTYDTVSTVTIFYVHVLPITVFSISDQIPPAASDTYTTTISGFSTYTGEVANVYVTTTEFIQVGAVSRVATGISYSEATATLTILCLDGSTGFIKQTVHSIMLLQDTFTYSYYYGNRGFTYSEYFFPSINIDPDYIYVGQAASALMVYNTPIFGFQDISNKGISIENGASLTADQTFYINTKNTAYGAPASVIIPFNVYESTERLGTSSYYSQNIEGNWEVTTSDSSTSGSFIVNVGTAGNPIYADIGGSASRLPLAGYETAPLVMGGAQYATSMTRMVIFLGYGHRYTLRDELSTTEYTTIYDPPFGTLDIGTKTIAYEPLAMKKVYVGENFEPMVVAAPYSKYRTY